MTTPSSAFPQGARDNFDAGSLSWVMVEIREALSRSKTSLFEAVVQEDDSQSTSLRLAKTYLHQAHGALQIVDIDGVAIITETVEDLLDRLDAKKIQLTQEIAKIIESAYQALVEYLEELLAGGAHQPVRLFPYYKSLLEVRGDEKIHPADLFFPNLAIRPQLPPADAAAATRTPDYVNLRQRYERALLPFLKASDAAKERANAGAMCAIIGEIQNVESNPQARSFWWVMQVFAEAVTAGQIANERYVKQLFARINLQIRRLSEGAPSVAERLLRDALFFIARVQQPSPEALHLCSAYQLDGVVPADYDKKRYGQVDAKVLVAVKERLANVKNIWNRITSGDASAIAGFSDEMKGLAEAGGQLGIAPFAKLLLELNGIARHGAYSAPTPLLGMEMATALLFVENSLAQISHLPENFSERADAMAARLLAIVAGETPTESTQWLDDMSREAQQQQTMTVLVEEMQTSLRQAEKMLDEYFREPSQRDDLAQIGQILHQIGGALAILDQDEAIRAVKHTQAAVQRFIDSEDGVNPALEEFQQVAQNVGALSFFIETLQLHPETAKSRFVFDDEGGIFHAKLVEKKADADVALTQDDVLMSASLSDYAESAAPAASSPAFFADDDKVSHQQQSAEELNLPAASEGADLLASFELADSDGPDASEVSAEAPQHDGDTAEEAPVAAAPLVTATAQVSDDEVDAELLEIFLSEAEEVLACVKETVPLSMNAPHHQEHLTTLRRSFHTLKGSGRMVGLNAFGEAAWGIEQVLNMRLADGKGGDDDLYALLNQAHQVQAAWVADLQAQGRSDNSGYPLVQAAERMKAGLPFSYQEDETAAAVSEEPASLELPEAVSEEAPLQALADEAEEATDSADSAALPQVEEEHMSDSDMAAFGILPPAAEAAPEAVADEAPESLPPALPVVEVIEFPSMQAPDAKQDDSVKRIGDLEISVPLHNIYLAETDELIRLLTNDFAEWRHEMDRGVNIKAVYAAHSLAGSSATVGFQTLQEVAHALEMVLQFLARKPVKLLVSEYDTLEQGVERLRQMLQMFALGEMPGHEPEQVLALEQMQQNLEARVSDTSIDAVPEVATTEAEAGAAVDESATDSASTDAQEAMALQERVLATLPKTEVPATFAEPVFANKNDSSADPALIVKDDLDTDLLPVFLEEGGEMLPQMGQALRAWLENPADAAAPQSILRILHTVKGSARMAGAMELGQHMHEMETRIEQNTRSGQPSAQVIEDLLARHDLGMYLFDRLQNPDAVAPAAPVVADADADGEVVDQGGVVIKSLMPAVSAATSTVRAPLAPVIATPASQAPVVRVRADILDRLVNQAGEVSISRSKLETEVGTLRSSLSELTENVVRLREQLREIEMQAETQITSRMAQSGDREFDPLEFDRFTRLQEITRMMAESVNDVASVQQNLNRTVDSATSDLYTQARLTRDLQQDLMRVRMVQFASISERLYRVTRQASKEIDKRVNLDIRGSAVEIDRSVLEKMAGPFEHLLRNAIVHGIESREGRRAAGKSEIGELRVEIRQEGNEVVIQFTDDGQGLNLSKIREKAKTTGLLTDDMDVTDVEVTDMIFHPGFSTAGEVTELAGRGIGMDVVRSEASELGGRVAISTEEGKGAQFTIHLPLTLAVTQVVVLSTGGKTYAVPSVLVEQVQQLKTNQLSAAYNDGAVLWQGHRVPMHYLSSLLGDRDATAIAQQYSPLIILKSGNDRVAIHVDQIHGNREVVIKNIGPQLARMIGIAGATVLGSGEIVLILNPVPLAQRAAHESVRAPRILPSDAPESMGAVAEMARQPVAAPPKAEPVQGLRTQNIIMVVDDSLTVRRVTQRLLAREGYQVVLAKDGVDALEQLQAITPDVMLVDIEMPRMDGFDLTRNVRSDERTHHIPIIMITSRTATKHRNYAMELGVNEYLGKPYQEDDLLKSISGFIHKAVPAN